MTAGTASRLRLTLLAALVAACLLPARLGADGGPALIRAAICEGIKGGEPVEPAVLFSASLGRIGCFAEFEAITERTEVFHSWYHRGNLNARVRLALNPPRWSTFNSIQLRPEDLGPWRVEISDARGRVLRVLRFNVSD
jgi:hypothetical protein